MNTSEDVVAALDLPDEELARLAGRARARTLEEHTGERRADELLRWLYEARAAEWLGCRNDRQPDAGAASVGEVRS